MKGAKYDRAVPFFEIICQELDSAVKRINLMINIKFLNYE